VFLSIVSAISAPVLPHQDSWLKKAIPSVVTFIPKANAQSIGFLLASSMLGRFAVGITRCVADWPTLNTRTDQNEEDKTDTELERLFMEGLGVPANFLAIALGQDVGFKVGQTVSMPLYDVLEPYRHTGNHPLYAKAMLATFRSDISPETIQQLSGAKVKEGLQGVYNPLHKTLYEDAKINRFVAALETFAGKNFKMPTQEAKRFSQYFKNNNIKTNLFGIMGGMVASTLFSGVVWQWLNDTVIRKRIVPPLGIRLESRLFRKQPPVLHTPETPAQPANTIVAFQRPPTPTPVSSYTPSRTRVLPNFSNMGGLH
jgi:hypothetical protein